MTLTALATDTRWPRAAVREVGRVAAMIVTTIVVSTFSFGWIYLLRAPTAHWPGPRVVDALPLDELAGHSDVPLVMFFLAVTAGAFFIGVVARLLRFDGIQIALLAGAAVGAWLYVVSAISIFVVRQVPLEDGFDAARNLGASYLTAGVVAVVLALVAARPSGEQWITRLVPGAVGLLGALDVVAGTLPPAFVHRAHIDLLAGPATPFLHTLEVLAGVLLILCARGLGRRGSRAAWSAAALACTSLGIRLLDGFSVTASLACLLVAVIVLARREDFAFAGAPTTPLSAARRLVGMAVLALVYGVLTLYLYRRQVNLPFHVLTAVRVTLESLVISAPRSDDVLNGHFAQWFPWSLRAIVGVGVVWGVATWFAPWRQILGEEQARRVHAQGVIEAWGTDTLAPFTLRTDKAHYFYPEPPEGSEPAGGEGGPTTLIAFRVVRAVAICSGDPIGPDEDVPDALRAFITMCSSRGWRVAVVGASSRFLETYRSLGLRVLYHGDEAIIDVGTFSLAGGTLKSVRQAYHRLVRKGYTLETKIAGDLLGSERAELAALERSWLRGRPRKGFVMELDALFRLDGDGAIFVIGRNPSGRAVGFLEVAVCPASRSLSLSSMPRIEDAPNGLNAALIVAAVEWARAHDFDALSLNFSPGAQLFTEGRGWYRRVVRSALPVAKRLLRLQLDTLLVFNRHFDPEWRARYLVYERRRNLPRVIVAAMAAERYLPFADWLRGRDWTDRPVPLPSVDADRTPVGSVRAGGAR
jgi:lysyl-tRNA synthetase class 2